MTMPRTMHEPASPEVEAAAQALFDRYCARLKVRDVASHHPPGTRVSAMPPSYRDDYIADARAALEAADAVRRHRAS
ncbi:hypothetical protein SB2_11955 [Methylobacterium radiotolerans]|nr:hypothetical protein SB3_11150 [Methylobacterium radiotolerans]KTS48004.1 hypothetical protein SB2_11955 [Methylobacterium radiotolerans]